MTRENRPITGKVRRIDTDTCRSSACKNHFDHEHGDECSRDCECWSD